MESNPLLTKGPGVLQKAPSCSSQELLAGMQRNREKCLKVDPLNTFDLTFSSTGVPRGRSAGYSERRKFTLSMVCEGLVRDNMAAMKFLDPVRGPFFSDFFGDYSNQSPAKKTHRNSFVRTQGLDPDVFDAEFSSSTHSDQNENNLHQISQDGNRVIDLQRLVHHVVATVRRCATEFGVKVLEDQETGDVSGRKSGLKTIIVKERKSQASRGRHRSVKLINLGGARSFVNKRRDDVTDDNNDYVGGFLSQSFDDTSSSQQSSSTGCDLETCLHKTRQQWLESEVPEEEVSHDGFTPPLLNQPGPQSLDEIPPLDDVRKEWEHKTCAANKRLRPESEQQRTMERLSEIEGEVGEAESWGVRNNTTGRKRRRMEGFVGGCTRMFAEESLMGDNIQLLESREVSESENRESLITCEAKEEAVYKSMSIDDFCKQRILMKQIQRNQITPIVVRHGKTKFTMPLAEILLVIVQEMCEYEEICHYPRSVEECLPGSIDPFVEYTFPIFQVSRNLADMVSFDRMKTIRDTNPLEYRAFEHEALKGVGYFEPKEAIYGPVVKHLRDVLCNGEEVAYTVVETWLAEILFNPTEKSPVCPVISGPPGVGKSKFFDFVRNYVIGTQTSAAPTQSDQVTQRFNGVVEGKMLVVLNETNLNTHKRTIDVLKGLCSDTQQCIENKCKETRSNVPIYCRFCLLTNDQDPYKKLKDGERRFFIIKTKQQIMDHGYYKRLHSILENPIYSPVVAVHFVGYLRSLRQVRSKSVFGRGVTDLVTKVTIPSKYWHKPQGCVMQHKNANTQGYRPGLLESNQQTEQYGYDAAILHCLPKSVYMQKKLMFSLSEPLMFHFLFVVCKLDLGVLIPSCILSNYGDLWKQEVLKLEHDRQLTDLTRVNKKYYDNAFALFKSFKNKKRMTKKTVTKDYMTRNPFTALQEGELGSKSSQTGGYEMVNNEEDLYDLFDSEEDKEDGEKTDSGKLKGGMSEGIQIDTQWKDNTNTPSTEWWENVLENPDDVMNNLKAIDYAKKATEELRRFIEKYNKEVILQDDLGVERTSTKFNNDTNRPQEGGLFLDTVRDFEDSESESEGEFDEAEFSSGRFYKGSAQNVLSPKSRKCYVRKTAGMVYTTHIKGGSNINSKVLPTIEYYNFSGAETAFKVSYGEGFEYVKNLVQETIKKKDNGTKENMQTLNTSLHIVEDSCLLGKQGDGIVYISEEEECDEVEKAEVVSEMLQNKVSQKKIPQGTKQIQIKHRPKKTPVHRGQRNVDKGVVKKPKKKQTKSAGKKGRNDSGGKKSADCQYDSVVSFQGRCGGPSLPGSTPQYVYSNSVFNQLPSSLNLGESKFDCGLSTLDVASWVPQKHAQGYNNMAANGASNPNRLSWGYNEQCSVQNYQATTKHHRPVTSGLPSANPFTGKMTLKKDGLTGTKGIMQRGFKMTNYVVTKDGPQHHTRNNLKEGAIMQNNQYSLPLEIQNSVAIGMKNMQTTLSNV